jgi:hypothetical protein
MRIKAHWFKPETAKAPEEIAGAAAFIVWRVAQNALKTMREAGYDIDPGPAYFAFLAEFLDFLVLGADRIAHRRDDPDWRVAFMTALAHRVGEILGENESALLGSEPANAIRRRFVDRINASAPECAAYGWDDDGPGYDFLRHLGHRVAAVMSERDRTWAVAQVIEVEGPDAAAALARAMAGLVDPTPRAQRRSGRALAGE